MLRSGSSSRHFAAVLLVLHSALTSPVATIHSGWASFGPWTMDRGPWTTIIDPRSSFLDQRGV